MAYFIIVERHTLQCKQLFGKRTIQLSDRYFVLTTRFGTVSVKKKHVGSCRAVHSIVSGMFYFGWSQRKEEVLAEKEKTLRKMTDVTRCC